MELRCKNPECLYKWDYKGKMLLATCPSCRLKVKTPSKRDIKDKLVNGINKGEAK